MHENFTQFQENFYSKVKDLSLFNCAEFNVLKIVLDGLKVNYNSKSKISTPLFYSKPSFLIAYFLKNLVNKKNKAITFTNTSVLIFDTPRAVLSPKGTFVHYRYENIIQYYKPENCTIVLTKPDHKLQYDYNFLELLNNYAWSALSEEDNKLRTDLVKTFSNIEKSKIFENKELDNIKVAFQLFFNQFRIFDRLLKNGTYKICHFDGHYHREGLILALKRNKVKAIELQHGLIAYEDIFYVFPPQVKGIAKKALFPDKILVFSNYWKNLLLQGSEFEDNQIEVIGDYQFKTKLSPKEEEEILAFKNTDELIVIATQTKLHSYFIEYTKFLHEAILKNNLKFKILFKIHPSENEALYQEVLGLPKILKVDAPITTIFEYCKMQISIYSTTLYESLNYNVINYSLDVDVCKDYIDFFVENQISILLKLNELPFDKENLKSDLPSNYYYANFTPKVLHDSL